MARVALIDPHDTTPDRRELLDQVTAAFGVTPNMFRAVANSPAALAVLCQGTLVMFRRAKTEQIKDAVSPAYWEYSGDRGR